MFPSMDAFGGWGGVLGHRVGAPPQALSLSQLNRNYCRFPDTYKADYASLLRDPGNGADLGPLTEVRLNTTARVGFVGAGIGNLIAAYELARCGVTTFVFEADAWVGGRLHTVNLGGTSPCEMGAMRFPDKSKLFWHYYAKYWADAHPDNKDPLLNPFPNPGVVPTHINWQDEIYQFCQTPPYDQGSDLPAVLKNLKDQLEDRWGPDFKIGGITLKQVKEVLAKAVLSPSDGAALEAFWKSSIDQYESRSFASVLADAWTDKDDKLVSWDTNQLNAFATLGLGTGSFGPLFGVGFLEMLRLFIWDYAAEYQLPGTLTEFAQWMADQVQNLNVLNNPTQPFTQYVLTKAQVHNITAAVDPKTKQVYAVIDVNNQSWVFDYAVVGMSTRAMQYLKLDANRVAGVYLPYALPQRPTEGAFDFTNMIESVQAAIRRPNMMSASKTFVRIPSETFMPGKWPQYVTPNQPTASVAVTLTDKYPRGAYWLKSSTAYSGVLLSYAWGNDSTKMEAISDPFERKGMLAAAFTRMTSDVAMTSAYKHVHDALTASTFTATLDWQERVGMFGGFKLDYPGDYYHTSSLAFHYTIANATDKPVVPAQVVYLAGCSISFNGGWIEGAAMSGINVATAILKFVAAPYKRQVRSIALLDPPPFHVYGPIGPDPAGEPVSPDDPRIEIELEV